VLSTRHGTAIDARSDTAEDGSLRETECVLENWRRQDRSGVMPMGMAGYVFLRVQGERAKAHRIERIREISSLFVGGDTRYGLGHLRRLSLERRAVAEVFGAAAKLEDDEPKVEATRVLAHAAVSQSPLQMAGALELLGGWDRGALRELHVPLWQPGSNNLEATSWKIDPEGIWRHEPQRAS
jgi:hypothetical protein